MHKYDTVKPLDTFWEQLILMKFYCYKDGGSVKRDHLHLNNFNIKYICHNVGG